MGYVSSFIERAPSRLEGEEYGLMVIWLLFVCFSVRHGEEFCNHKLKVILIRSLMDI